MQIKVKDNKNVVSRILNKQVKDGVLEIRNVDKIGDYAGFTPPATQIPESEKYRRLIISGDVKSVGRGAFMENKFLEHVTIEEGVESLDDWAFFGCENLVTVKIPNSVKHIGIRAFGKCPKLANVKVSNRTTYDGTSFPSNTQIIVKEQYSFLK